MTQNTTGTSRGISRRWLAMGSLTLALITIGLDQTVLSLALPTLAGALNASESQLQWFVTSYTLALAAAMLPAGLLGDRYGRKTVLVGAIVLFGVMSIACAYAPTADAFIAARTLLGVAGAALLPLGVAKVVQRAGGGLEGDGLAKRFGCLRVVRSTVGGDAGLEEGIGGGGEGGQGEQRGE